MPNVGGKKYSYTPAGKKAAMKARLKLLKKRGKSGRRKGPLDMRNG